MAVEIKKVEEQKKYLVHQKIGVFIDAENIEMSGYGIYGGRTDYKKLVETIGGQRQVIRIIYYKPIHKDISGDFRKFWSELGGEIKQPIKNVDPFLIVDAITLADKLDVVVIVGGDKDYLPLLWFLKSRGCKAEVWTYPETASSLLQEASDYFYAMDQSFIIKDNIRSRAKRSSPRPQLKKSG